MEEGEASLNNVLSVAKHIIHYCNENNMSISNLRLQKLLYFIQAQFLVSTGDPCFSERIEAWDFGPVVPVAYDRYKSYGSSSIPDLSRDPTCGISPTDRRLIEMIVDKCSHLSTSKLVEITHRQSPWKKAYNPYRRNPISNDSIKEFFLDK